MADANTVIEQSVRWTVKGYNPRNSRKCTRVTLAKLYAKLGYTRGAEIGVRRGAYSKILCETIPNLELYLIDPWMPIPPKYPQERQDQFLDLVHKRLKGYNYHVLRKTSMDALADVADASLDFCFIDGDHGFDCCVTDIVFWSKKVKKGGIISVHDYYRTSTNGVVDAVDGYIRCHHIDPWYTTKELQPTAFWVNP